MAKLGEEQKKKLANSIYRRQRVMGMLENARYRRMEGEESFEGRRSMQKNLRDRMKKYKNPKTYGGFD
jgi:hypothetical protein